MKKLFFVLASGLSVTCAAQDATSATESPANKFSVSLQAGQPNRIMNTELVDDDNPVPDPRGTLRRYSFGVGTTLRYYTDSTFFLQARFAYSTRHLDQYDSITGEPGITDNVVYHQQQVRTDVVSHLLTVSNVLIGIGGGHEGQYGRFVVRAGGEIDYVRYTMMQADVRGGTYTDIDRDTVSGGHFESAQTFLFYQRQTIPVVSAIGISGHAGLEYKLTPNFGIGAVLYLGGYFAWTKEPYILKTGNATSYADSNGTNTLTQNDEEGVYDYNARHFDFSPLNGQINFVFYFGKNL